MDKWIKKLAQLGKKFIVPVQKLPSVKVVPQTQPDNVPKNSADSEKRGKVKALQQSGNSGSGTSAFKNNKAAFLKLANRSSVEAPLISSQPDSSPVEERQKENSSVLQQSGNIGTQPSPEATTEAGGTEEESEQSSQGQTGHASMDDNLGSGTSNIGESKLAEACPYCNSKNFIKRGTRKNKLQVVQLYECKNEECGRTFTAQDVKGKHFPLNVIIEGMSYYNLGFTLEQSCSFLKQKFGVNPGPATLSEWITQYSQLCKYSRLRPYAVKMCASQDTVEVITMAHRQLYRFRYHRAKTRLMLEEEYRNRRLAPLKDFLDNISSVTPHQYFQEGERMSEIRSKFDKAEMLVKTKFNYANRLADFVLQSVKDNKQRHEQLQRFMIANDSCTVATEVPVYIRKEDIEHFENDLRFKICDDGKIEIKGSKKPVELPKLLTGHIDFIQIRNGQIHLLDYKPDAAKEKPIEQLTWYALAMCRLTGLRLYDFTCAWFDDKDFFQFYPLHVVKKLKSPSKKKRKIFFKDGTWGEAAKKNELVVVGRDRNDEKF